MKSNIKKKKKRLKFKTKLAILLTCLFFIVGFLVVYYFQVVCPIVVNLSKEKVYALANTSVSEVVGTVLTEKEVSYNDLVKISYSANGDVEVIEIDSVLINILIKDITSKLQERFDSLNSQKIDIPAGAFTGIPFLFNSGPMASVQLVAIGTAKTSIDSQFVSSGINQTLHKLNLIVSVNIGMLLPANTKTISSDLEVMICQCLIVGKIPNIYLQGQIM